MESVCFPFGDKTKEPKKKKKTKELKVTETIMGK